MPKKGKVGSIDAHHQEPLGKVERECLLLRAEGLRYREIAEVMGIGCSTVADTLERALRKLVEECDV